MRSFALSVAGAVGLLVLALASPVASAAPTTTAPSTQPAATASAGGTVQHLVKQGMQRTGFDAQTARSNGFIVRRGPNGNAYGWKLGYTLHTDTHGNTYATPAAVTPDSAEGDYAYGNCGYSFIYFNAAGASQGYVNTGYGIDQAVNDVHWVVEVSDSHGQGTITINRGAEPWTWSTQFYTANHLGYAEAAVFEGSFAIEKDGSICWSEGPVDDTTITL